MFCALPDANAIQRAHIMNPLVPGLQGTKMSSSDAGKSFRCVCRCGKADKKCLDSKIDLLDPPETVTKKIRKALCVPKEVEGNGVLSFTEFVLLPAAALRGKKEFVVERRDEEPLVYTGIEQMHEDWRNDVVRAVPVQCSGRDM